MELLAVFPLLRTNFFPSLVSRRSGNYTRYFPSVTNCINLVHDHASINDRHLGFPVQLISARRHPAGSSAQSSWTAKPTFRLEQGTLPPSETAHILLRQPIKLTLTWHRRGTSLTLRWIASLEMCGWLCPHCPDETSLINNPSIKVSRPYCSTAASHHSHLVGEGGGGE